MMTGPEFRKARERAGFSYEDIAGLTGKSVETVAGWERGQGTIPRVLQHELRRLMPHMDIWDEVEERLKAAGYRPCEWAAQHAPITIKALHRHAALCATCAARDRIATELAQERRSPKHGLLARLAEMWHTVTGS
jgi:transcriptional regulator with XRE-family HTH domain